jgi:3-oxoacyl-[acyl-carrier-protein] synthase-1/3-oxoacyl-[acyl-carrier-protein] synthase II
LGIVLGYGSACDGYHATSPHPQARGLIRAFDFALKQTFQTSDLNEALIKANEKIAFINAHATASIDNDMIEGKALKNLFPNISVTATKSLTGHCLGAAGAVEACITLICLNENKIPKTKNFDCMDENINLIPVLSNTSIDGSKAAISNSLSFGGCNSVLILGGQNYE